MERKLEFNQEELSIIKGQLQGEIKNLTEYDVNYFIYFAEMLGLNPIAGDCYLQKFGKKPQIMTTRDGMIRAASQDAGYNGPPVAHAFYENDTVEITDHGSGIRHEENTGNRGKLIGAYAIMHHKEYPSITQTINASEYYGANSGKARGKGPNLWDKMPSVMLQKTAEVSALRRMFPLGMIYTQEEMNADNTPASNPTPEKVNVPSSNSGQSNEKKPSQKTDQKQEDPEKETSDEEDRTVNGKEQETLQGLLNTVEKLSGQDGKVLLNSLGLEKLDDLHVSKYADIESILNRWIQKAKEKFSNKEKKEETQAEQQEQQQKENSFTHLESMKTQANNGQPYYEVVVQEKQSPFLVVDKQSIATLDNGATVNPKESGNLDEGAILSGDVKELEAQNGTKYAVLSNIEVQKEKQEVS